MTRIKEISNIILILLLPMMMYGQRFNFGLKAGLNFSQVNGDRIAGYDKLGLDAGVKTNILINDRIDMVVELLYSQRGAASEISWSGNNAEYSLIMNYIAIPVLVELKDWISEEKAKDAYYRLRLRGGLAFGRLISLEENGRSDIEAKDSDLSIVLGAGYYANRHLGFSLRYTRSILSLDEVTIFSEPVQVIPHHVTLSINYMFI